MHTLASRMSARERELAPRYYYKRYNCNTVFASSAQDAQVSLTHERAGARVGHAITVLYNCNTVSCAGDRTR